MEQHMDQMDKRAYRRLITRWIRNLIKFLKGKQNAMKGFW